MCSSRLDLRLGHFKAFIAVSLLGVLITILPTHFCRVSRVSLFNSPQHPQTPAQYSKVGLIIDKKNSISSMWYNGEHVLTDWPACQPLDTIALTCSSQLRCSSKMTPRYLNSVTRFIADPLLYSADPISVYRTKRKSPSLEQCLNLLPCQHALWPWADRCSFEDSCKHQETLWSSSDCKHLESRKQPCNIASQLSSLISLMSFCHGHGLSSLLRP